MATTAQDSASGPIDRARESLPDNWRLEDVKLTSQGSMYTMLVGRIEGTYNPREPCIIVYRTHDADEWKATAGRDYVGDDDDLIEQGGFQAVLQAAIEATRTQNEGWAAIRGFSLPGGDA